MNFQTSESVLENLVVQREVLLPPSTSSAHFFKKKYLTWW